MTAVDSANNVVEIPPQLFSDFSVHMNMYMKIQLYNMCCVAISFFQEWCFPKHKHFYKSLFYILSDDFTVSLLKMKILDPFINLACLLIVCNSCAAEVSGAGHDGHEKSDNDQES